MADKITVEINPLPYYNKYASSDYVLCLIDFYITCNGSNHNFRSETSNNCIMQLLSQIDDYLSGKIISDTELFYDIPWILGDNCIYPYSFQIDTAKNSWIFRYKKNPDAVSFDFFCDISRKTLVSMRDEIKKQYSKIDWNSLGQTPLYTFDFSGKEFDWCYSAKELCKSLNDLCVGKSIKAIYVSAANYAAPLTTRENWVNYYLGDELIIQTDGILLDLLIFAGGLFKWRVFEEWEYSFAGPNIKFIENGDVEFCDIGNVYNMFTAEYTNINIRQVCVNETDDWPWSANGFDESKLGNLVELPEEIRFSLANNYTLSLCGTDDDFIISLCSNNI